MELASGATAAGMAIPGTDWADSGLRRIVTVATTTKETQSRFDVFPTKQNSISPDSNGNFSLQPSGLRHLQEPYVHIYLDGQGLAKLQTVHTCQNLCLSCYNSTSFIATDLILDFLNSSHRIRCNRVICRGFHMSGSLGTEKG
jgi:hypothetical protein